MIYDTNLQLTKSKEQRAKGKVNQKNGLSPLTLALSPTAPERSL